MADCNSVYTERNRLVAALTKFLPSYILRQEKYEEGWQYIVYVFAPEGQMSWHFPDHELEFFSHLTIHEFSGLNAWDGHTTEEKYKRLESIASSTDETCLSYKESKFIKSVLENVLDLERGLQQSTAARQGKLPYEIERTPLHMNTRQALEIIKRREFVADEMGG